MCSCPTRILECVFLVQFIWGVKSTFASKTHLTVHSNGQFLILYVKNSFVCHYLICMSLLHLYVTTLFVCQNLVTTSLGPTPSLLPGNKFTSDLQPLRDRPPSTFYWGSKVKCAFLALKEGGPVTKASSNEVLRVKWGSDIQMKFWHTYWHTNEVLTLYWHTNEIVTYKWNSDIQSF